MMDPMMLLPADEAGTEMDAASRRAFFRDALRASAVPAIVVAGAGAAQAAGKVKKPAAKTPAPAVVQADAVSVRGVRNLYPGWAAIHFKEIQSNENAHLAMLLSILGPNARPMPTFQNIVANDPVELATMGAMFCSTGAGAYLGASQFVDNKTYLVQSGSLGQIEAYQAGWLDTVLNGSIVPNSTAFAPALPMEEVMNRIAPFLVSLNGGPPAMFSTTEISPENDIAILNFALILEYAEHVLYDTYVPKFYGAG